MLNIPENLTMPSGKERSRFDVTVPGQSLTKPPKQYPWESPPRFSTPDEVMEFYLDRFGEEEVLFNLFAMLESKIPVSTIVNSMVMSGFAEGMYSPDLAILIAEELAMLVVIVAEEADIDYELGAEDKTVNALKQAAKLKAAIKERDTMIMPKVEEKIEEIKEERSEGGLMSPTKSDVEAQT